MIRLNDVHLVNSVPGRNTFVYLTNDSIEQIDKSEYFKPLWNVAERMDRIEITAEADGGRPAEAVFRVELVEHGRSVVWNMTGWSRPLQDARKVQVFSGESQRIATIVEAIQKMGDDQFTKHGRPDRRVLHSILGELPDADDVERAMTIFHDIKRRERDSEIFGEEPKAEPELLDEAV